MLKTVLVTAVTSRFGLQCAKEALGRGYRVIGTVSNSDESDAFEALSEEAFAYRADFCDRLAIVGLIRDVERHMAPIDILIATHDCSASGDAHAAAGDLMRPAFDVRVLVPLGLMASVRPHKFALEEVSGALARELAPLGIRVTLVPPGSLRRALAELPMLHLECKHQPLDDGRAARAVFDCIEREQPPLPLYLRSDALRIVRGDIARFHDPDAQNPHKASASQARIAFHCLSVKHAAAL